MVSHAKSERVKAHTASRKKEQNIIEAILEYEREQAKPPHLGKPKSINEVAKKYKILYATLNRCVHGGKSIRESNTEKQKLTPAKEWSLVQFILESAERGFPLGHRQIEQFANANLGLKRMNEALHQQEEKAVTDRAKLFKGKAQCLSSDDFYEAVLAIEEGKRAKAAGKESKKLERECKKQKKEEVEQAWGEMKRKHTKEVKSWTADCTKLVQQGVKKKDLPPKPKLAKKPKVPAVEEEEEDDEGEEDDVFFIGHLRVLHQKDQSCYPLNPTILYHASLVLIYRCPNGHFHRVIYGIGPYIADYPEQVWLVAVVQNWCPKCEAHPDDLDADRARLRTQTKTEALPFKNNFPRVDISELLSSDLLHQVIMSTFKDHIVSWVNEYLHNKNGEKQALEIIQDIDRRISAVPEFPGLRRFPDGRDFSQWTGDDSKALMKVNLTAVAGYPPSDMMKCLLAFMEFCYLVHRNAISASYLTKIQDALDRFHEYRQIFITCGVHVGISLPQQHSLKHYVQFIPLFGCFNALSQMLRTLVCLNKLAALKVLAGEQPQVDAVEAAAALDNDEDNDGLIHGPKSLYDIQLAPTPQRSYPKTLQALAAHIQQPQLPALLHRFLQEELHSTPDDNTHPRLLRHVQSLPVESSSTILPSRVFYAPSNLSSAGGMYCENIRSNPNWHRYPRHDTVLVDAGAAVMRGLVIGHVSCSSPSPSLSAALNVVELERCRRVPMLVIIPVDSIAQGAHLIGVYGTAALPEDFHFSDSLDAFNTYFVNPYADHHMHEFLS
ncbi:hypothetical protein K438DRAFT_1771121 [Mycena galopus ATCC 62051]|nr:hypothetical protein K438DRAFT_1771121 [Mycena galopus ATCC 62051]